MPIRSPPLNKCNAHSRKQPNNETGMVHDKMISVAMLRSLGHMRWSKEVLANSFAALSLPTLFCDRACSTACKTRPASYPELPLQECLTPTYLSDSYSQVARQQCMCQMQDGKLTSLLAAGRDSSSFCDMPGGAFLTPFSRTELYNESLPCVSATLTEKADA